MFCMWSYISGMIHCVPFPLPQASSEWSILNTKMTPCSIIINKHIYIYIILHHGLTNLTQQQMLALHIKLIGGIRKGLDYQEQMHTMVQQRVHGNPPACSWQSTPLRISPMSLMGTSNILLSKAAIMFRMRLVNHVSCCCCCFMVSTRFLGRVQTFANLLANRFIWKFQHFVVEWVGNIGMRLVTMYFLIDGECLFCFGSQDLLRELDWHLQHC